MKEKSLRPTLQAYRSDELIFIICGVNLCYQLHSKFLLIPQTLAINIYFCEVISRFSYTIILAIVVTYVYTFNISKVRWSLPTKLITFCFVEERQEGQFFVFSIEAPCFYYYIMIIFVTIWYLSVIGSPK